VGNQARTMRNLAACRYKVAPEQTTHAMLAAHGNLPRCYLPISESYLSYRIVEDGIIILIYLLDTQVGALGGFLVSDLADHGLGRIQIPGPARGHASTRPDQCWPIRPAGPARAAATARLRP
jgi:hypothetical protein